MIMSNKATVAAGGDPGQASASADAPQTRMTRTISIAASWARALQGEPDLAPVLSDFAALLDASSARLLRYEGDKAAWRTVCEAVPGRSTHTVQTKSHAAQLLADHRNDAAVGTVWSFSRMHAEDDPARLAHIEERLEVEGLADVAIVVLQRQGPLLDILEFQFGNRLLEMNENLLVSLAPEVSRNWCARRSGTFHRMIARYSWGRGSARQCPTSYDILGAHNPCSLSRSEFRVCVLLSQGLLPKQIATQLQIRLCTVRSHLTSIYAKTETSGQLDLMHRLYAANAQNGPADSFDYGNQRVSG
ncbi:MAG: helix-turn-helix transcriptional regulator [Pseudomonadota bacterium]